MRIYFQGAELPTYRNLIKEMNVGGSSLSFLGLLKRTKNPMNWEISKYFPAGHKLFVDSGAQVLNNAKEQMYSQDELRDIVEHYYEWIDSRNGELDLFSEFDANGLGGSFLRQKRLEYSLPGLYHHKFLPIWHGDEDGGINGLRNLGDKFGRVGIAQTSLNGRDLLPVLNRMASAGIALHGLAMTKPDVMQAVKWTSVSSTSWTTPQRYGDTIIWSHGQLKRYPKSMKEQARKKERAVIIQAGFDYDKIAADDPKELLRLSLWSWTKLADKINKTTTGVTAPMNSRDEGFTEYDDSEVDSAALAVPKRASTVTPRDPDQRAVIPLLNFTYDTEKKKNKETGETEYIERSLIHMRSDSMRICDTCFLAAKCPMMLPGSNCAYDIPIQVETKEQMQSLMNTLVSMQTQRVLFMKMSEDMEGGMADPVLSAEIDRLGKLIEKKNTIEQEGFSLTITAKQQGEMGMVDRIFGDMGNTKALTALPSPQNPQSAAKALGFDDDFIDVPVYDFQEE